MKAIYVIAILLSLTITVNAQSKKDIVKNKIEVQRTYGQNFRDGDKDKYIDKEEFYDINGELIEVKEYAEKGQKIKSWFKYKYDEAGNVIEELELDPKASTISRVVYKFENGMKKERLEYDNKDRLVKKREYEYYIRK